MPSLNRSRNLSRGQALVETALILPIFLALMLGIVDMGRAVWATTSLASAAREAARFAIVHGGSTNTPCPVGPISPTNTRTITVDASCPYPSPSKQSITVSVTSQVDLVVPALLGRSSFTLSGSSTMVVNH